MATIEEIYWKSPALFYVVLFSSRPPLPPARMDTIRTSFLVFLLPVKEAGGYKEMSSIFADQYRPRNTSPNAGGGVELRGFSQWVQYLCTSRDMEPK